MPATPFDSALYGGLFSHAETAALFTDGAEIRSMLLVEGALARAQGELGIIPEGAAIAIHRAGLDALLDPGALARATAANGVPVPALVAAFRAAIPEADARPFVHWGATSQDIADTGLALRLRRVAEIQRELLCDLAQTLAMLAETHRAMPMAGRTWGMAATPTSFGAVVAAWGWSVLHAIDRLDGLVPRLAAVSLSGAAGTLSAMDGYGSEVRALMAEALRLADPGHSIHTVRAPLADFASWMATTTGGAAKLGEDALSLVRAGEATLAGGGGSSTMPQKQNPVAASVIVALARHVAAMNSAMVAALPHRDQRDGTAWLAEWLALPQLCIASSRALALASEVARGLAPVPDAMASGIDPDGLGLIHAEALQFRLARRMPRPDAQTAVKDLVTEARANGVSLAVLAKSRFPDMDVGAAFDLETALGEAPSEADRFVVAVRALFADGNR